MNDSAKCTDDPTLLDSALYNVGQLLTRAATNWPDHTAIAEPDGKDWRQVSFAELESDANQIAAGLLDRGLKSGQRVALMVPPGIDFVALVFALYKMGAIIILIDPGIGKKNLVQCLSETKPDSIVGIAKAQIARWVFRKRLPDARQNFVVGKNRWPGCHSIETIRQQPGLHFEYERHEGDKPAAIIFTSGSTGPPKGVAYSHRNFITQAIEIRDYFDIRPGGAEISGFPLFALFNAAMGMTTVFPEMDFTRPANISPQRFLDAAEYWEPDQAFGSPALWNTVSRWCKENRKTMPSIIRAMSAGAPVPTHVLKEVKSIIAADGDVYTPYGATEALPVACNSASVVLNETASATRAGKGVCVGGRFRRIHWKVIEISDAPVATLDDARVVDRGQIGELIVSGPAVTTHYVTRTESNALAKTMDGSVVWHRMGDVGYLDERDRFWFCGRKSQRVIIDDTTFFTVPCESIINTHPAVYRSALVSVVLAGKRQPVIVVEPWPEHWPSKADRKQRLINEIQSLSALHEMTRPIRIVELMRRLPVDIRHNSKIFREKISAIVSRKLGAS